MKPGYKTSEFWVTLALVLAGLYMIVVQGNVEVGGGLLGAAGVGYTLSRGVAKRGATA